MEKIPNYINGQAVTAQQKLDVQNKHNHQPFAEVCLATETQVEQAICAVNDGFEKTKQLSSFERQTILEEFIQALKKRKSQLIHALICEAGKTITDAEIEYHRAIHTLKLSAEEACRISGELLNLDNIPQGKGYLGFTKRVPIGPCLFITPFNFPLNLLAHKVGPAIASGCSFIIKPSEQTPVAASLVTEALLETSFPTSAVATINAEIPLISQMVSDDRIKLLSFTGSSKVGWKLKEQAGKKKVLLELGGVAICVVDHHVSVETIANKVVKAAFYQAGQSCISVQRILIHKDIYPQLKDALVAKTKALKSGSPENKETFISPLISLNAKDHVLEKIGASVQAGAQVLCGFTHNKAIIEPTILEQVPTNSELLTEEIFGPVLILEPIETLNEGLSLCNQTSYGLQIGIFTRNITVAHQAFNTLDYGSILINEVPTWRNDSMPYGGTKESGIGREGIKYAIQEMTILKNLIFNMNDE